MSWHNSTKCLHDNVEHFFSNKEVTLDLIHALSINRIKARKELDKARSKTLNLHSSSKANIKHMSCAEHYGYTEMLLIKAIELYTVNQFDWISMDKINSNILPLPLTGSIIQANSVSTNTPNGITHTHAKSIECDHPSYAMEKHGSVECCRKCGKEWDN